MAGEKRASMREGPLAALFRRTELPATGEQSRADGSAEGVHAPEDRPAGQVANSRPAFDPRPPSDADPAVDTPTATPADAVATPADPVPSVAPSPPAAVVPSPSPPAAVAPPAEPAGSRSGEEPKDRLARVFSMDLPNDILEPAEPAAPRYGRELPDAGGARREPAVAAVVNPVLRVVGVGGAGVNAIDRMIEAGVSGVEFVAINTDMQSLQGSSADVKLHIGGATTRGLGAGADPSLGRQAAMADYDAIKRVLKGSDMIFIAAGAGGGTGTGAGPIVARIAREVEALTVGIVTTPFDFEGSRRRDQALEGVNELAVEVDTLITVPNNRLLAILDKGTTMVDAFRVADDVLRQGVQGISDLVTLAGLINIDFADVRTIMTDAGPALLGIGMGTTGETRAVDAATKAVSSPLLETNIDGARSILLSITGGTDLSLWEVNEAAKAVAEAAHPEANIIFGATIDPNVTDQVWVTVVATRYQETRVAPRARKGPALEAAHADREPRVSRGARDSALAELEVPEFMPRV